MVRRPRVCVPSRPYRLTSETATPSLTDKTIKLWKVFEKQIKIVAENNMSDGYRPTVGPIPGVTPTQLRLPRLVAHENIVAAVPRKVYANAHAYHINSISINSDGETYISADDLRVNLWNLGISDQSFSESCHVCLSKL
jgi:serine/threonine-protein phosphatase 2A regulatory subunit B